MSAADFRRWLLVPAVTAAGVAVVVLQPRHLGGAFLGLMVVAAVLSSLALGLPDPLPPPEPRPRRRRPPRWSLVAAVGAVVVLLIDLTQFSDSQHHNGAAWLVYVFALVVLVVAATRWTPALADGRPRATRREILVLLVILAVAAAFRFHLLGSVPYGIWFDEAENTLQALRILHDPGYRPVFIAEGPQMPALSFYLFAPFVAATGAKVLGVRLAATFIGLAAVLAVWILGRELFSPAVGLIAAALLAVSRWHVDFSRFGMAIILATLFAPLVLLFFFRALRRLSARDAVLGGVVLGLGLQTYYSMLAVPPLLMAILAHSLITEGGRRRRRVALFLLFLVTAVVVYGPVLKYAFHNTAAFGQRISTVAVLNHGSTSLPAEERRRELATLAESTRKHLEMFHIQGDPNGRHNLPGRPMLEPATGLLMAIGLLWCLVGALRDTRMFSLVLWTCGMLAPGILSVAFEAPQGARTLGVLPAVLLAAALPAGRLWSAAAAATHRRWRVVTALFLVVLVGSAAAFSWRIFFHEQRFDAAVWAAFSTQETRIGEAIAAAGPGTDVYLPPALNGGPTEELIVGRQVRAHDLAGIGGLPLPDSGHDALVVVEGSKKTLLATIHTLYPRARTEPFGPPRPDGSMGEPVLWIVHVPREAVAKHYGWTITNGGGAPGRIASSTWTWPTAPSENSPSARVEGALKITDDGPYRFAVNGDVRGTFSLDGGTLITPSGPQQVDVMLARGLHRVEIEAVVRERPQRTTLAWAGPRSISPLEPIPPSHMVALKTVVGGLLGRYYSGERCQGTPVFQRIDPRISFYFHKPDLPRPYCVTWEGQLLVSQEGLYHLGTVSIDETTLAVDGAPLLDNPGTGSYREAPILLEAGLHSLNLTYNSRSNSGQVYLYWTRPDASREVIPPAVLRPPPATPYGAGEPASAAAPAHEPPVRFKPVLVSEILGPTRLLRHATRIATAPDGTLFALDPEAKTLLAVDLSSQPEVRIVTKMDLADPADLAVSRDGTVWVLDISGFLLAVDDGHPRDTLDIRSASAYNPRGITFSEDDSLLISDTGHGRILAFDRSGTLLWTLGRQGSGPSELGEPMAAVAGNGTVTVVEALNRRIQRLSLAGRSLGVRALRVEPWGIESPRLAADRDGSVWICGGTETLLWWAPSRGALQVRPAAALNRGLPRDIAALAPGRLAILLSDGSIIRVEMAPRGRRADGPEPPRR